MNISGRIYHRGSIKLPDNSKVDIMVVNLLNKYEKIREAELVQNKIGIFDDNIKYLIKKEYLDQLISDSKKDYLKKYTGSKVYDELTISCMGRPANEYKEKNEVVFSFFSLLVFIEDDIKEIIRDLKLNTLV